MTAPRLELELERRALETAGENGAGVGAVPLGPVDAAYVGMIEGEYQAAIVNARQLRELRYRALRTAYHVPAEALLTIVPGPDGAPAQLQWTVPPTTPPS